MERTSRDSVVNFPHAQETAITPLRPTPHHDGARWHATTVIGVCRDDKVALAADGQVTFGDMVVKHGARKLRVLHEGQVLAGFAGAAADALALFEKFESQLTAANGDLRRAAVELTKEWRTDRELRRLEAQLIVANADQILILSGEGDVLQPDDGIASIGAGSPYATAAARALLQHTNLGALEIVQESMRITSELCIFTNERISVLTLPDGGADDNQ